LTSTSVFADMTQGLFQPVLPGNECRPVTGAQTTLTPKSTSQHLECESVPRRTMKIVCVEPKAMR
jgi:hypothetical protein